MSKQTGLAAFTTKKQTATSAQESSTVTPTSNHERKRGKGSIVALTIRLSRGDWERVHQLALAEGTSIQQLAMKGISKVFKEKGLPDLDAMTS